MAESLSNLTSIHIMTDQSSRLNRIRQNSAKYCKLTYSSHFGFSFEGSRSLGMAAASLDSTIAISEDGEEWSSPSHVENAAVFDHGSV
jgi:hypothetical protein